MRRIKMILVVMLATVVLGTMGTSAAQAGTGTGDLTVVVSGTPTNCLFTFNTNGWSGGTGTWSTDISGIAPSGSCGSSCLDGTGTVTKHSNGDTEFSGVLRICIYVPALGASVECTYDMGASGTWAWGPGRTYKLLTYNDVSMLYDSGSIFCPGAPFGGSIDSAELTLEVSNP